MLAFFSSAVEVHQRRHRDSVDPNGHGHRRQGQCSGLVGDGAGQPVIECLRQVIDRADAADTKP